jgi:predicted transport protein
MAQEIDPQVQTMIDNMPEKTGKTLEEWFALLKKSGLEKHGEMMKLMKGEHGVTHGFANTIALLYRQQAEGGPASDAELVASQYAGAKAGLKPLYEQIVKTVQGFGGDVELAPKKAYVSLRRSKQFGIVQPSTKERLDIGLILKGVEPEGRLEAGSNWNSMCTHRIRLHSADEFDDEVVGWLKEAYERA